MKSETTLRIFLILCLSISTLALITTIILYTPERLNPPAKAVFDDPILNITFYTDKAYVQPGENLTFYFEITNNKVKSIKQINITSRINYVGDVVYSGNEVLPRNYQKGETIKIEINETLPITTTPGEYLLTTNLKIENISDRWLVYEIYVQPRNPQMFPYLLLTLIFGVILYLDYTMNVLKTFTSFISRNFTLFTGGQKFAFLGVVALIISALTLAGGLDSLANEFAIIAYFFLVIGVANNLLDYINWGDTEVNYALSILTFAAFFILYVYNGIGEPVGKIFIAISLAWATFSFSSLEKKQQRNLVKYLIIPLILWVLFNLSQDNMPYYSTGLLLACIIYLSRDK